MSWRDGLRSLVGAPRGAGPGGEAPRDAPWVEQRPDDELTRDWLARMRASGWVLPPSLARDDAVPSWTRLGVADGSVTSTVDPRGLVTVAGATSLDWAVGAEDRWHHPARAANVTQARIEGAPVVETTLPVPGGTVVHRAFGARAARYPGGDDWLVVEVENRSAVPVVLAWVVRPFSPVRLVANRGIELLPVAGAAPAAVGAAALGADPTVCLEVYDPVGLMPRPPSRWVRTYDGSDPLDQVVAGGARPWPMPALQGEGAELGGEANLALVSAAFLVPLPHTATARILLLPSDVDLAEVYEEDGDGVRLSWPADVPTAAAVARGWSRLAEQGPRVELPDPVLAEAVAAARRSLPLSHRVRREAAASDQVAPPSVHWVTSGSDRSDGAGERMEVLATLAWWGEHAGLDPLFARWPDDQQRGGGFGSPSATAAALRALAVHVVASGDVGAARAWLPEVSGAVEHLGKALRRPSAGTDPADVAEGLEAGALLLARLGQLDAAARVAADAVVAGERSVASRSSSSGARAVLPERSGPAARDGSDGGGAAAPSAGEGADGAGPGRGGSPLVPRRLAAEAVAAARAGRPSDALWALLRQASATWTWSDPERWVGDDGLVQARLLDAVARLLVADRPEGPALIPWLPPSWWGRGWEVHGAPTRWGPLSYAVRWHGDRPAVLWDLTGEADGEGVPVLTAPVLTAPGLDPAWSSSDRRGEALLARVAPPPEVLEDIEAAEGTGDVAVAAPPRSVWRPQDPGPDAPPGARPPEGPVHPSPSGPAPDPSSPGGDGSFS